MFAAPCQVTVPLVTMWCCSCTRSHQERVPYQPLVAVPLVTVPLVTMPLVNVPVVTMQVLFLHTINTKSEFVVDLKQMEFVNTGKLTVPEASQPHHDLAP